MKIINTLFCLAVVLLIAVNASSQTVMTEKELKEIFSKSFAHRTSVPHRMETVFERLTDKNLPANITITQIIVAVPPDSKHYFSSSDSDRGSRTNEQIVIGKTTYDKLSDGKWVIQPDIKRVPAPIKKMEIRDDIPRPKMERSFEYRGKEQVSGKMADLYVIATKMTPATETEDEFYVAEEKHWIDENGVVIKDVKETYSQDFMTFTRITTTYEYDPNLKIEPPLM